MPHQRLTPHQKLGLGFFIVVGIVTFIFGLFRLQKSAFLPFYHPKTGYVFKTEDELEQEHLEQMKKMDTDHDGLSDYDELYVYHTSPYLEDSDSDGVADGVEVSRGTDPN